MRQIDQIRHSHSRNGGVHRAVDPHAEPQHKYKGQPHIQQIGDRQSHAGPLLPIIAPDEVVKEHVQKEQRRSGKQPGGVVPRHGIDVPLRGIGPQQPQDRLQENLSQHRKADPDGQSQYQHLPEYLHRPLRFALAHQPGKCHRAADGDSQIQHVEHHVDRRYQTDGRQSRFAQHHPHTQGVRQIRQP